MKALLGRTCAGAAAGVKVKKAKASGTAKAEPANSKARGAAIPAEAGAAAWAAALIAGNYQAEDFRRLLGVNRFNDVTWFNKEAFEESLFYLSCFCSAEDEGSLGPAFAAGAGRAAFIAEFDRIMLKAEEKSGYRLDGLITALSEM
jgi:hypothetical protein